MNSSIYSVERCPQCGHHLLSPVDQPDVVRAWDIYSVNVTLHLFRIEPTGAVPLVMRMAAGETLYALALVRSAGKILTREFLWEYVHGNRPCADQPSLKIVDVMICKLRKRMGQYADHIRTERGVGYQLLPWVHRDGH